MVVGGWAMTLLLRSSLMEDDLKRNEVVELADSGRKRIERRDR